MFRVKIARWHAPGHHQTEINTIRHGDTNMRQLRHHLVQAMAKNCQWIKKLTICFDPSLVLFKYVWWIESIKQSLRATSCYIRLRISAFWTFQWDTMPLWIVDSHLQRESITHLRIYHNKMTSQECKLPPQKLHLHLTTVAYVELLESTIKHKVIPCVNKKHCVCLSCNCMAYYHDHNLLLHQHNK